MAVPTDPTDEVAAPDEPVESRTETAVIAAPEPPAAVAAAQANEAALKAAVEEIGTYQRRVRSSIHAISWTMGSGQPPELVEARMLAAVDRLDGGLEFLRPALSPTGSHRSAEQLVYTPRVAPPADLVVSPPQTPVFEPPAAEVFTEVEPLGGPVFTEVEPLGGATFTEVEPLGGATFTEVEPLGGATFTEVEPLGGAAFTEVEPLGGATFTEVEPLGGAAFTEVEPPASFEELLVPDGLEIEDVRPVPPALDEAEVVLPVPPMTSSDDSGRRDSARRGLRRRGKAG